MEMTIKKHSLSLDKVFPYFQEHVGAGNAMSAWVLKNINLSEGVFYTILPVNAVLDRLFKLKHGGIIPQGEGYMKSIQGMEQKVFYVPLTSTEDNVCDFLTKYLQENTKNRIILEEMTCRRGEECINIGVDLSYTDQYVYYILKPGDSKESIFKAVSVTNDAWHFLAVCFQDFINIPTELTDYDFENICNHVKYIVIGAYDRESFIFWEKNRAPTT